MARRLTPNARAASASPHARSVGSSPLEPTEATTALSARRSEWRIVRYCLDAAIGVMHGLVERVAGAPRPFGVRGHRT